MVKIIPLDRWNWERFIELEVGAQQSDFVPSVLFSLAQANFEKLTAMGVLYADIPVGFLMYARLNGIFWVNRILIDKAFQQKGIGREALMLLISELEGIDASAEIRTSCAKQNHSAIRLFEQVGFQRINEALTDELVFRLKR